MAEKVRLTCPECGPVEDRKEELRRLVAGWLDTSSLKELLTCFGIAPSGTGQNRSNSSCFALPREVLSSYIEQLWEAVQIWDFRGGAERWNIKTDDPRIEENKVLIERALWDLGFMDVTDSVIDDPDYILPLGGARMTNYDTPEKARSLIESMDLSGVTVAGLSTERSAAERDKPYYEQYAFADATEFEAMCCGMKKVFDLTGGYTGSRLSDENPYLCSEKRIFDQRFRDGTVAVLSAPSSEPEKRRANTIDTFLYFLEEFDVEEGSEIIFTTNSVYVPFQLMKLMNVALERNIRIDCVGVRVKDHIPPGKHARYLQEIKATIDAIYDLGL